MATTALFELVEQIRAIRLKTKTIKRMKKKRHLICNKSKRILKKYHRLQSKKNGRELNIRNILNNYTRVIGECLFHRTICDWLDFDLFLNNKRK